MRMEGFFRLPLIGIFLAASKNSFIGNKWRAGKGNSSKFSINGRGAVVIIWLFSIKLRPATFFKSWRCPVSMVLASSSIVISGSPITTKSTLVCVRHSLGREEACKPISAILMFWLAVADLMVFATSKAAVDQPE